MSMRARTLNTAAGLADARLIAADSIDAIARVGAKYAIAVPPALRDLAAQGGAAGPIARQFVPDARELDGQPGEIADPIGDHAHSPVKGIVHRYDDRLLLKIVGTCPVYCRFCFRREMVGPEAGANLTPDEVEAAIAYIAATPRVREVIVTGGDPFVLSPRRAQDLTARLVAISHVARLRWHTRVPVATPERVTDALAAAVASGGKPVRVAVHVNHADELTPTAIGALRRLSARGIALVSQSVLLEGVNADADRLVALMRALAQAGVAPYYLHHPDLAPGTRHFRLPLARGLAIYTRLREALGSLVPAYMLDIPGGFGKVAIDSPAVRLVPGGALVTDRHGRSHIYEDLC